jgi:hypothetical protein
MSSHSILRSLVLVGILALSALASASALDPVASTESEATDAAPGEEILLAAGKVVDQDGNPLAGAELLVARVFRGSGVEVAGGKVLSGPDGSFEARGKTSDAKIEITAVC